MPDPIFVDGSETHSPAHIGKEQAGEKSGSGLNVQQVKKGAKEVLGNSVAKVRNFVTKNPKEQSPPLRV